MAMDDCNFGTSGFEWWRGSWSAAPRSVEDEVKFLSLLAGDRGARRVYLARQAVVAGARARAELEWNECRAANGNKHHAQPEAGLRRGRGQLPTVSR